MLDKSESNKQEFVAWKVIYQELSLEYHDKHFMCIIHYLSQELYKKGKTMILILHMRQLKYRKIKGLNRITGEEELGPSLVNS